MKLFREMASPSALSLQDQISNMKNFNQVHFSNDASIHVGRSVPWHFESRFVLIESAFSTTSPHHIQILFAVHEHLSLWLPLMSWAATFTNGGERHHFPNRQKPELYKVYNKSGEEEFK